MRIAFPILLLLASVAIAAGPEITPIPAPELTGWKEIPVASGKLVEFSAAPASSWDFIDDVFDGRVFEGGKRAVFLFPDGRHRVIVTGPDGGRTRIVFVAGNGPGPGPTPPIDSLAKELAALYAGEPAATRLKDMQSLAALYLLMIDEAANPAYTTAANLNAKFVEARDLMLSDKGSAPRLPTVRKRCGAEVAATIGDNPDAPLTDVSRKAVAAVYARLAKAVSDATK